MAHRQRLAVKAEQVTSGKAHRLHSSQPSSVQVDLTASQRTVLAMQRAQGNHSVLRMVSGGRLAVAQRAPEVGWRTQKGKLTTGPNQAETFVPMDAKNPTLGGARRIPVRGLSKGSSASDENELDWLSTKVSDRTDEKASEKQAIVILPDNLDLDQPIGVLLHLQGLTIGYRSEKGKVEDVDMARIEQQLRASERNMIGILPQGGLSSGAPNFGGVNRDDYVQDVFDFLDTQKLWATTEQAQPTNKPKRGPLVYSSYSGGAFTALPKLEQDVSAKNIKSGNINPSNMAEVILFDSIHVNAKRGIDQVPTVNSWLFAHMNRDLDNLNTLAQKNADPVKRESEQLQYLATSMRFRGIHTDGYYAKQYKRVKTAIENWFNVGTGRTLTTDLTTIMSPKVIACLTNNYQVISAGHKDHATLISQGDPLKNALNDLPTSIGKTTGGQKSGKVQPATLR